MTHLYYGDVSRRFSEDLALTLIKSGADILEIGIPYSDPVSDGSVFQKACKDALENGVTPIDVLNGIKNIRRKTDKPIYLTSYFGPIFRTGIEKILRMGTEAGVSGLIIPDLPIEEQVYFQAIFKRYKIPIVQFATVYSSEDRLNKIIKHSEDFVYCVTLSGVTGDKSDEEKIADLINKIKRKTKKKIFCGFGIKTANDAKRIIDSGADGVIVGSTVARIYQTSKDKNKSFKEIGSLVKNIKNAIK